LEKISKHGKLNWKKAWKNKKNKALVGKIKKIKHWLVK
jgi:hypothetical protein